MGSCGTHQHESAGSVRLPENWSDIVTVTTPVLAKYLQNIARTGQPVHYIDVTEHFGLPRPNSNWRNHILCKLFIQLDEEDAGARRPFRTAMVTRKKDKVPGQGFFLSLHYLRKIPVPTTLIAKRGIHRLEVDALKQHYQLHR